MINFLKNNLHKATKTATICLVVCAMLISFSGCRNGSHYNDFPAIWECDEGDIKITILTTGYYENYLIGTLTLDDEEFDICINSGNGGLGIVKLSDFDLAHEGNVWYTDYYILTASYTGYKESVTLSIGKDNTNREGKESLSGRKFVLKRHDLY